MSSAARRPVRTLLTCVAVTGALAATTVVGAAGGASAASAAGRAGAAGTTATGSVFMVNPVQSSGDQSLTDAKDSAAAVPASQYATVTLTDLDGSGYLRGTWANVIAETGTPAYSPTGQFTYRRDDDRFEQVMAYFWATQTQRYLQSLGFGTRHRPVNAESQDLRTNQWGQDNSYSWDKHDVIRLGKGGVDDAEDAEVVVHEYGHAVHDAQVPGFGVSVDAGAIGEGFGDYLAVVVGQAVAQGHGWPVRAPLPCVMDWDATSYTTTTPHCLRRIDTALTVRDRRQSVHFDGQVWSGALWDARSSLGAAGSRLADEIVIEAQFGFAPDTSWAAAATETVRVARVLGGASAAAAYQRAFEGRGIL